MAILILGGGFLVLKNQKKEQKQPVSQEIVVSNQATATEIDKDSDDDGLKDWEESLWKTDPNNPDTDKDGTSDYTEIKDNRNPLVASKSGKDDKLENQKIKESSSLLPLELPSLTDLLSQQFFNDFLFMREKDGGQISQKSQEELIASFIGATDDFEQTNKGLYLKSDLKIDLKETPESLKEYGNNLALIIKKYFDPIPETEMTILKKYMDAENETEFKDLERIAAAYRNTAGEMLSLKTPLSFSDSHLNLANLFKNIAEEIGAMQKSYDDPVQALLALKQYQTDSSAAYEILRDLNYYFLDKKIVFENNEPAELFKVYLE